MRILRSGKAPRNVCVVIETTGALTCRKLRLLRDQIRNAYSDLVRRLVPKGISHLWKPTGAVRGGEILHRSGDDWPDDGGWAA
jgi:hypothetical protein